MLLPTRRNLLGHAGGAMLAAAGGSTALAQGGTAKAGGDWPTRPVRIVVNFGPGGGSDNAARPFAERLSRVLGQQVVIENKGGASGAIGAEAVVKAAPDGYTFLATPALPMVALPHMRKLSFDPLKDLVPIASFVEGLLLVATGPSVPGDTLQDFVAHARANPGKLGWGTAGVGTYSHFICETFKHHAGVDILHVPYRAGGEAIADFLAGVVQVLSDPSAMQHVATGKAKLRAVLGPGRRPDYPDVPLLKEVYPEVDFSVWFGIMGPIGTPPTIIARLSAALNEVAAMPEVRDVLFGLALIPTPSTPEAARRLLEGDHARFGRLIQQFGIKAE